MLYFELYRLRCNHLYLFKGEVRDGADGEGAGGRSGEEQDQGGRHGRDGDEALGAVPPAKLERRRGDVAGLELTDLTHFFFYDHRPAA